MYIKTDIYNFIEQKTDRTSQIFQHGSTGSLKYLKGLTGGEMIKNHCYKQCGKVPTKCQTTFLKDDWKGYITLCVCVYTHTHTKKTQII